MTTTERVVVRLRDRPDTLERVSGLLRRRGFALQRLSSSFVGHEVVELVICIDPTKTDPDRVCRELATLHDVIEVACATPLRETRELLLARLRDHAGKNVPEASDGILEMIGSPEEIDAVLESLHTQGAVADFVRSGEVAVPKESRTHEKDQK